jgi:prophage regulatory protein
MSKKIIRLPEVKNTTGLSRSSIYLRMSNGEFPQSISLGSRAVGWLNADIEKWLDECVAASKAAK